MKKRVSIITNICIVCVLIGLGVAVFDNEIEDRLTAYMGLIFEEICKQWLYEQAKRNALPFFIGNLGRWWGTNPATRTQEEIDIMAARKDEALFAECKWKHAEVDVDVMHELKRKSELFGYQNTHLYIFSNRMFSGKLLAEEYECDRVKLYTFSEMIDVLK